MRMILGLLLFAVVGCTATQLNTPQGQLFCQLTLPTGQVVAPIVVQKATNSGGVAAGQIAVIVTNALATDVANACAQAATNQGGTVGVPVPPPAGNPVLAPVGVQLQKGTTLTTTPVS